MLSRQVRTLQMQSNFGNTQYQRQSMQFVSREDGSSQGPTQNGPIAFAVNCFYQATPAFRGTLDALGLAGFALVPTGVQGGTVYWDKSALSSAGPTLQDKFNWMARTNVDTVSPIQYYPLTAFHIFKLRVPVLLYTGPIKFKFQFIKTKRLPGNSNLISYNLPAHLGAYNSLCSTDIAQRRSLSKKYHEILQTKYITIGNKDIGSAPGLVASQTTGRTAVIEKSVTMKYTFGRGALVRPDYNPTTSAGFYGANFCDVIDDDHVIWCLISSNIGKWATPIVQPAAGTTPAVYASPYELECYRYLKWKDQDGDVWGGGT